MEPQSGPPTALIVVDTTVLSLAFRRRVPGGDAVDFFHRAIEQDDPVALPGVVVQEVLTGLRRESDVARLHDLLLGFPWLLATGGDHLLAARVASTCRRRGVAAATVDCLIAAQTMRRHGALLTTDVDFLRIAEHVPLRLVEPRSGAPPSQ